MRPVKRATPTDDLSNLAACLCQHLLKHQIVVDRRHAPDRSLDRATIEHALGKLRTPDDIAAKRGKTVAEIVG